jgi:hypothetical protein
MAERHHAAEGVLGEIVERSHLLHPDELVAMAEELLARLGAGDLNIYTVDYGQTTLVPVSADPSRAVEPYNIDSTVPGRAYRTSRRGDAFDYGVSADTAHIAILDAMGHGLEASRIANLAVGAYRNARRRRQTLLGTYRFIDEVVAEQYGDEHFVTGQLAELDLPSGSLRWVSAGHPRPLLVRRKKVVGEIPTTSSLPLSSRATGCSSTPTGSSRRTTRRETSTAATGWPTCWGAHRRPARPRPRRCAVCRTAS